MKVLKSAVAPENNGPGLGLSAPKFEYCKSVRITTVLACFKSTHETEVQLNIGVSDPGIDIDSHGRYAGPARDTYDP